MTVLTCLFFALFFKLGLWQLQRADEKRHMIDAREAFSKSAVLSWSGDLQKPRQYERIQVTGSYLKHRFLLDNQHHEHQFGYHVITPLLLSNGAVVMVDRGWIAGDVTRRQMPLIPVPEGTIQLQGSVYYPSKKQWLLGPEFESKGPNMTLIEVFDEKILNQLLQKKVYPFIIRMDKTAPEGFLREWATVSMPPQRHVAYAVQWFGMAFIVMVLFFVLNIKKRS